MHCHSQLSLLDPNPVGVISYCSVFAPTKYHFDVIVLKSSAVYNSTFLNLMNVNDKLSEQFQIFTQYCSANILIKFIQVRAAADG